ncbi:hypothetical protein OG984_03105 [Nocardioides sp. NBC_00368]|uniref:hypothetical protein n=1 Tax=Nocardioides sp. NBC_00368 TaxID=2976000 RepID=UPI002E229233
MARGRGTKAFSSEPVDPNEDFDGVTVDGEVLDDAANNTDWEVPRAGRRRRGHDGPSASQRARDYFRSSRAGSGARQARQQERATHRARAAEEAATQSERDQLLRLREDVRAAGVTYMQSLSEANILVPGFTDDERAEKVSELHQAYTTMMMFSCLRPLKAGVNARSVLQAAGMMSSLWLMSPAFRNQVGEYRETLRERINERLDMRALAELEAHHDGAGLRRKWAMRLRDIEYRQRGHRHPFTAESAGMTLIALSENAFERIHADGSDIGQILKSHRALIERVYSQAEEDGLSRSEIDRAARIVLGQRLETEPELQVMFSDLAHGRARKSDPRVVKLGESGPTHTIWTGEFEDSITGQPICEDTMFDLRGPMGLEQHQSAITQMMAATMSNALNPALRDPQLAGHADPGRLDIGGFTASMTGYMLAWQGRREPVDLSRVASGFAGPMAQTETMLASMSADGLDEHEQQEVYSCAFADALEQIKEAYPGLDEAWGRAYSKDWDAFVNDAVKNPTRANTSDWGGFTGATSSATRETSSETRYETSSSSNFDKESGPGQAQTAPGQGSGSGHPGSIGDEDLQP